MNPDGSSSPIANGSATPSAGETSAEPWPSTFKVERAWRAGLVRDLLQGLRQERHMLEAGLKDEYGADYQPALGAGAGADDTIQIDSPTTIHVSHPQAAAPPVAQPVAPPATPQPPTAQKSQLGKLALAAAIGGPAAILAWKLPDILSALRGPETPVVQPAEPDTRPEFHDTDTTISERITVD